MRGGKKNKSMYESRGNENKNGDTTQMQRESEIRIHDPKTPQWAINTEATKQG
jgi:hypothetical protein